MSIENEYRMSHQARVRDRKRKTYQEFLKWVNDPANAIPDSETISKNDLRIKYLAKAFLEFPDFENNYNEQQCFLQKSRIARDRFNGELVKQITGLEGKDLGNFMRDFVDNVIIDSCKMTRVDWAISRSIEEIKSMIRYWHNKD